jgi:hypothetical protein
VGAAQSVNKIVAEIAAATREQSAGIGEINNAIAKLDQMTSQNAALVEHDAASAAVMLTQTNGLSDAMNKYKITPNEVAAVPRRESRAVPVNERPAPTRRAAGQR